MITKKQQQFNQSKTNVMKKVILKSISAHSDQIDELPINYKDSWLMHRKYVEFCKQPLNLGMFVPAKLVDGVWVVFEEPKEYKNWIEIQKHGGYSLCHNSNEYQKALDRILFDGFEIKCHYLVKGGVWLFLLKEIKNYIIEDILKDFEDVELELTPTAQKQIGI